MVPEALSERLIICTAYRPHDMSRMVNLLSASIVDGYHIEYPTSSALLHAHCQLKACCPNATPRSSRPFGATTVLDEEHGLS
jgi:hypothetical protein